MVIWVGPMSKSPLCKLKERNLVYIHALINLGIQNDKGCNEKCVPSYKSTPHCRLSSSISKPLSRILFVS